MRIGKYRIGLWALSWRLSFVVLLVMALVPSGDPTPTPTEAKTPEPLVQGIVDQANLTFTIVQVDAANNARRVLQCTNESCAEITPPGTVDANDALFDGTWWYFYEDKALVRQRADTGDKETIKQTTDLVAPRSAVISPDGSKVAYWLDSRTGGEDLTEIWVFDAIEGGSQIIAEKISKPDVLTRLRWNASSTALTFLADNSVGKEEKIEPVIITVAPISVDARFTALANQDIAKEFNSNPLDINESGTSIAITKSDSNITDLITAYDTPAQQAGSLPKTHIVNGTVPYIEWQPDGTLFYVAQVGSEITFWRAQGSNHIPVNTVRGVFRSAHSLPGKNTIAFIADTPTLNLRTINITSGEIADYAQVPSFGQYSYLVNATANGTPTTSSVTAELNDGQMTAFIQQHITEIVEDEAATPVRMLTTDQPNTVYVDYEAEDTISRVLVTIKDAIYPEWEVHSHFESIDGQWSQIGDNGQENPPPQRLYEWEESISQWVLK